MEKTIKALVLSIVVGILIFQVIGMARADIITPGYSPIEINNKINNLNDFPDYVFVVAPDGKVSNFLEGGRLNIVGDDGIINTPYYKMEDISVYAIKESEFDQEYLENLTHKEAITYLETNTKKVITQIKHYETRAISSPVKVENYEYQIDLSKTLTEPTNTTKVRDNKIYYYVGIPIIALIIIVLIIIYSIKKKNKK
jgi:hypothetical protein